MWSRLLGVIEKRMLAIQLELHLRTSLIEAGYPDFLIFYSSLTSWSAVSS